MGRVCLAIAQHIFIRVISLVNFLFRACSLLYLHAYSPIHIHKGREIEGGKSEEKQKKKQLKRERKKSA